MNDNVRIVLVNPSHPGNIGAAARAMKNMGFGRLVLVAPRKYPHEEAEWRAAGATDVLARAEVVPTLGQAIADCQLVVGTSARGRRIPWPVLDPRACASRVEAASHRGEQVALLFGREDRGLTNEELQVCNLHLHIPSHEDYSSLNLAMAVQVVVYELPMQALTQTLPADPWDLEETLIQIGFLDPAAPRQLMARLRRLYSRVRLDEMELNILRGILTETQQALARAGSTEEGG